jgi:hypothetical protein
MMDEKSIDEEKVESPVVTGPAGPTTAANKETRNIDPQSIEIVFLQLAKKIIM